MPKHTPKLRAVTSPGGHIHVVPRKARKPKAAVDHSAAWAKAAQQYAGNIYHLPSLTATHAPGPGPVARGIKSASTHLPVTSGVTIPKHAPGPGPSAPAGSKVRKSPVHKVQHYVVGSAPSSLHDLDAIMATPRKGKRTMKPTKSRRATMGK